MAFSNLQGSEYAESVLSMKPEYAWYAVYTASRAEKKVKERLDQMGIENYLPLKTEYRIWSDRKKKVTVPLVGGYIFVHVQVSDFLSVLMTTGIVSFLKEKGKAVMIPGKQIEQLKYVEKHFDEPVEIVHEKIPEGTLVEVVKGKLSGFQGEMIKMKDKFRIVIRLEKLGCALLSVPVSCVEVVKN